MFYKKPGKLGATTLDVWIGVLTRRGYPNPAKELAEMLADKRLAPAES